jgi:hypothetical protein
MKWTRITPVLFALAAFLATALAAAAETTWT